MRNFAAIDFETANWERSSVCSVGVVVIRDGRQVDSAYRLIRPEPNWYWWRFSEIHGLTRADTDSAPTFPEVWAAIEPLIGYLPLVAHNSQFDEYCLRAAHKAYGMDYPEYPFLCTCQASRLVFGDELDNHQLQTVAKHCGYDMYNHHNSLADAEACAAIAKIIL